MRKHVNLSRSEWFHYFLVYRPPMPYNIFFSEVYSTVMAANPKVCERKTKSKMAQFLYFFCAFGGIQMTFADASRIISMMWNAMGSDVKQV